MGNGHNKIFKSFLDATKDKEGLGKRVDYSGHLSLLWTPHFYYINVDFFCQNGA